MRYFITVTIGVLLCATLCLGKDIYVPKDYSKIQDAIDVAWWGDTIIVSPGTYYEVLDIQKTIHLKSAAGPRRTVIHAAQDPNYYQPSPTIHIHQSTYVLPLGGTVEGFTIRNGINGITVAGAEHSVKIRNNIIIDSVYFKNFPPRSGIFVVASEAVTISNNIIAFNGSSKYGGGVQIHEGDVKLINNTIWGNYTIFDNSYGGGVYINNNPAFNRNVNIVNTIIANNQDPDNVQIYVENGSIDPQVSYSCIEGGYPGSNNIDVLPVWSGDPEKDLDFHLTQYCACIDAGDNYAVQDLLDYEGDPRICKIFIPNCGTVDIGADERCKRVYHTGKDTPGSNVRICLISSEGVSMTGFVIGTELLQKPISSKYGTWWLDHPLLFVYTGWTDSSGIVVLDAKLPAFYHDYQVYIQGFAVDGLEILTDLYTFYVHL